MDHQHALQLNGSETSSFTCSGCKEQGFGSNYICENKKCNDILHKECAKRVIPTIHPFLKNYNFEFHQNDKVEEVQICNACGKVEEVQFLGFYYSCSKTGYAMHTCCLNLQHIISHDNGNVIMTLCQKVPSNCFKCNQRQVVRNQLEGWSYVFDSHSCDGKSCIHVSCYKNMILESLNNNNGSKRRRMRSFMKSIAGKLAVNLLIGMVLDGIVEVANSE